MGCPFKEWGDGSGVDPFVFTDLAATGKAEALKHGGGAAPKKRAGDFAAGDVFGIGLDASAARLSDVGKRMGDGGLGYACFAVGFCDEKAGDPPVWKR